MNCSQIPVKLVSTHLWNCFTSCENIWAAAWQNKKNAMCAQRRLRSAWASAQSDQSLRCRIYRLFLSLRWVHISFCWFCRAAAHMVLKNRYWIPKSMKNDRFTAGSVTWLKLGIHICVCECGIRFQCIWISCVNAHAFVHIYKDTLPVYLLILIFSVSTHAYAYVHMDS